MSEFMTWDQMSELEQLETIYCEMHKDVYGVKARWYRAESVEQNLKEQFARALIEQCARVAEEWYLQAESLHWDVGQHIRNHFWIQE